MKNLLLLTLFLTLENAISQYVWEPTNGPNGLNINDVVVSTTGRLIISIYEIGIYISDDRGLTWNKSQNGLLSDRSFAEKFISGPNGLIIAKIDNQLYHLYDGVLNWRFVNTITKGTNLIAMPKNKILYLYDNLGDSIIYSRDSGRTLVKFPFDVTYKAINQFLFNGDGKNYINVDNFNKYEVYQVSDDGSVNKMITNHLFNLSNLFWHPSGYLFGYSPNSGLVRMNENGNNYMPLNNFTSVLKFLMITSTGNLIAFTNDGDYESYDLGLNWKRRTSNISSKVSQFYSPFYFGNDFYVHADFCDPISFAKTSDTGISWTVFDPLFTNSTNYSMFISSQNDLFTRSCGKLNYQYSTNSGKSWSVLSSPDNGYDVGNLISTSTGYLFLPSDNGGLFESKDYGKSWKLNVLSDSTYIGEIFGDQNKMVFVFGIPNSYMSKDGGVSWKTISDPHNNVKINILIHPDGTVFSFGYKILYSDDDGVNWNHVNDSRFFIAEMKIAPNGDIYFYGKNLDSNLTGLYVSKDKLKSAQLVNDHIYIDHLFIDHKGILYVTGEFNGECCLYSSDEGISWNPFEMGLPKNAICDYLDANSKNELFISVISDVVYKTVKSLTVVTDVNSRKEEIILTPNPVDKFLNIKLKNNDFSSLIIGSLFDMTGRAIFEDKSFDQFGKINFETVPNGLYILKLNSPILHFQKLIVQH